MSVTPASIQEGGASPRGRRSTAAKIAAGLALVGLLLLLAFLYSIGKDQRKGLDVATAFGADVYLTSQQESIVDTTADERCARLPDCVQMAESARIRIMRFDSKSAAGAYVLQLAPDGYHSDWFVVEFLQPDTMTREEYRYVESAVYGLASKSPD